MGKKRAKYKWKKRPYAHQVAAVKFLLSTGWGGALLMEPRTGKTKVVVDYASILHTAGHVNRILIFCPVSAIGVWEDQIEENCPVPHRVTIWDRKTRKGRMRRGVRIRPDLPRFGDDVLDFVIMNYDALSTPGAIIRRVTNDDGGTEIRRSRSRGGRFDIKKKVIAWAPQLMVLDESHRIKSPTARKTTMLHTLQTIPQYRVIMTGTVVTKKKKMFDIYAQWKFLNPERFADMTFTEFKSKYARWLNRNGYQQWIRNINERELHKKIHLDAFSTTRDECYDLPRINPPQIIHVELEESGEIYDRMAEDMVARIRTGEITEASIKLVQGIRLRQITSGITRTVPSEEYPKGKLHVIGSEKLRVWSDRIQDLMEADEKVVVGALWKADIWRLNNVCKKLKIPTFIIQGGLSSDARRRAWEGFRDTQYGAVFIGQPAAAGEAIDLSSASIMQWYSLTPSWVNYRQFSDRIALSDRPTFFEFFLARGTVDELLFDTLQEDGDIGKAMITSPERLLRLQEWS